MISNKCVSRVRRPRGSFDRIFAHITKEPLYLVAKRFISGSPSYNYPAGYWKVEVRNIGHLKRSMIVAVPKPPAQQID
jgi:hypothetical protein